MSHPATGESDDVDPLIGRVFDERYRIEAPLGQGGLGKVYRARHLTLGKMVALKVLLAQYESIPVLKQRFAREAEALAALSHPNIVTVADYGVETDTAYIVMELLEGRDLSELLMEPAPLEPRRALDIVRQTLRALAYAHAQDLVHRDLKPQNIFVRQLDDGSDHVTVLDFGLARFMGEAHRNSPKLTRQGALIGTPAYMAPEQASGDEVDERADVYAVGLVLFEALTGRRVFEGANPGDVLRGHLTGTPPTIAQGDPGLEVDPRLEAWLARSLQKAPAARFPNVREMITAFDDMGMGVVRRVGPRPPRDRPLPRVGPTQAPGATRAATPSARQQAGAGATSIALPTNRLPLLALIGCLGLGFGGGLLFVGWWLLSDEPAPRDASDPNADPTTPTASPDGGRSARADAQNPFSNADALPPVLAQVHAMSRNGAFQPRSRVSRQRWQEQEAVLQRVVDYAQEHPDEPIPLLIRAHALRDQERWSEALDTYEAALTMDISVRGDPEVKEDLIYIAMLDQDAAGDPPEDGAPPVYQRAISIVLQAYGDEAAEDVQSALRDVPYEREDELAARMEPFHQAGLIQ